MQTCEFCIIYETENHWTSQGNVELLLPWTRYMNFKSLKFKLLMRYSLHELKLETELSQSTWLSVAYIIHWAYRFTVVHSHTFSNK